MIDEDYRNSLVMGIGGMPGTFPTNTVLVGMYAQLTKPERFRFTRTNVNAMWYAYKDAVLNERMDVWGDGKGTATREYMQEVTGYSPADILIWLKTVYELARTGKIKSYFWNFDLTQAPAATKLFDTIGKKARSLGKTGNVVLAVVGIGTLLFGGGYLLNKVNKFNKAKKKLTGR